MAAKSGSALPPELELETGFHEAKLVRHIAKSTGVSTGGVVASRVRVAKVATDIVIKHLTDWRDYCKKDKPLSALSGRKYDSASFPLRNPVELPGLGKLAANQTSRPIHVFVQRRVIILAWEDKTVANINVSNGW